MMRILCLTALALLASQANAQWRIVSEHDSRQNPPASFPADGRPVKIGDEFAKDQKFRWLVADLEIPEKIGDQATAGKTVGLQVNCADGGEVYVNGHLEGRFDNDHPLLAIIADNAKPKQKLNVAIQVFGNVQGGGKFDEATFVLVPDDRTRPVSINVNAAATAGDVPDGLIGLSQGGGMSDYEDATAKKLRDAGFKWFRTDNVLTNAVSKNEQGQLKYDWKSLDERVDFIHKVGAAPILAASYMPQVFDAVPDNNRQSAPNDYAAWEELCYQAAKHCMDRGKRVPYWEVWNEANSGWIKPGPQDTGSDEFKKLYQTAIEKEEPDHEIVRRFEAYAKLYRATARGVRRADPQAKIGGPASASGPFENSVCGSCQHGKGFARGLMLWCQQEKLPLDFLSWHEYFQSAEEIAKQADAFRSYLHEFPQLEKQVTDFMLTEWNEAWWPNRPHDHEIGAAWCADGMIRAIIPKQITKPCFFYVKQGDNNFRGDWSMLMQDNRPKPSYNMARMFNSLRGQWLQVDGGSDDICAIAAMDDKQPRLAIILVNFRFRYAHERKVELAIDKLPAALAQGVWRESIVDAQHGNIFNDASHCELEVSNRGKVEQGAFKYTRTMPPNAVVMLELTPQ
jgi:hypothetical protein